MEFNIEGQTILPKPSTLQKQTNLPLSKLYYWCSNMALPDTSDKVMLCSVPLISSDGTVYGVCGFEVSTLLFKLSYTPDTSVANTAFCLLSRAEDNTIDCSSAFMAAQYSAVARNELTNAKLRCHEYQNSLNRYLAINPVYGYSQKSDSLSKDSPYNNEELIVSLLSR